MKYQLEVPALCSQTSYQLKTANARAFLDLPEEDSGRLPCENWISEGIYLFICLSHYQI